MAYSSIQPKKRGFMTPAKSTGKVNTPSLLLDCVLSEKPSFASAPTESLIETGSTVSDHVQLKPVRLTIQAIVSNSPVTFVDLIRRRSENPAQDAFEFLKKLLIDRLPFDYIGGLQVYPNMILVSLEVDRTASTANALVFTASMQEVILVESQTVLVGNIKASAKPIASGEADKGSQTGKETTNAEDKRTKYKKMSDALAKIL